MGCHQPLRLGTNESEDDHVTAFRRDGYAIVRGLFSATEIEEIAAAADQIHGEGVAHGRSFRHGNLFYDVAKAADGGPRVRMAQWPSYHQQDLNRVRLDSRFALLLEPLIGPTLKQIIASLEGTGNARGFRVASGLPLPKAGLGL